MTTDSTLADRRRGRGVTRRRVTIRVAAEDIEAIEDLVDDGEYPNRSEAIREAIAILRHREGV